MNHRRTLLFVFSFLFLFMILILVSVTTSRSFSTEKRSKAAGSVEFSQRDYEQWFYDDGKPLLVTPVQTMGTISADKLYYLWFNKQNNKHDFTGPQGSGKTITAAYPAPATRGIVSLWGVHLQFATVGETVCLVKPSAPQTCVASLASLSDGRVSVMREFHDLLTGSLAYYAPGGAYWEAYMDPNYGVGNPNATPPIPPSKFWRTRQFGPVLESFSQIYPYLYSSSLKKQVEERIFTPYSQYLKSQIGSYFCGVWSDYAYGECMTAQFLVRGLTELIALSKHHQLMLPLQTDIPNLEQKTTSVLSLTLARYDTWLTTQITNYNGSMQYMTALGIQSYFNSAVSKQKLLTYYAQMYERMFSTTIKWQWDQVNHIAQNSKTQSTICGYQLGFGSWPHNPPGSYSCPTFLDNHSVLNQLPAYHWLIIEGLRHWSTLLKQFSLYSDTTQRLLQDVFPATISWIYQMSKDNGCVFNEWPITIDLERGCGGKLYAIKGLATALLALDNPSEHFPYYQNYPVDDNGRPLSQKTLTFDMLITRMRKIWASIKKPDTTARYDMTVQECGLLPQLSFIKNIHIYSPSYAPPTGHLPLFTPTPTARPSVSPTPIRTPTATGIPTATPAPSRSPTPTQRPTGSLTPTTQPSISPTPIRTPTPTGQPNGSPTISPTQGISPADFNHDGKVDIFDYNILLANFGKASTTGDMNGDGKVDIFDYNMFVSMWGK